MRPDVAVVAGEDRVVVLALTPIDSVPLELTGAGLAIWRQIDGRRRTSDIVSEICRLFDAGRADVASDVETFLVQLEHAAVLERGPAIDHTG